MVLNLAAVSVKDHAAGIEHAGATAAAPTDTLMSNTLFARRVDLKHSNELAEALHLKMHTHQAAAQQPQQDDQHGDTVAGAGSGDKASSAVGPKL